MPLTEGYPHPELLETPTWLADHLRDAGMKVLDGRPAADFATGHIPGAISLPGPNFKAQGSLETCSEEEFAATAGMLGISATDTVICCDATGPTAARLWWAFTRFGHHAVRYLHGGLPAWQAAGLPLETTTRAYPPTLYELGEPLDHLACALPEAIAKLDDDAVVFWDTRSAEEFSGERTQNNPPDQVGHLPRAVHLEWNELTDPATGLFRPAAEMRRVLESKGITPEKEVVAY